MSEKIWFTSDLHFGHKRILKFVPNRIKEFNLNIEDEDVITIHDKSLIEKWNKTISKRDTVYILGDVSFASVEETKKILEKLNGKKHLILGNHDGSCASLNNYFVSVTQIKEVMFKKIHHEFLDEDMCCVLCHYPLIAWNRRMHGSVMLHGHTHGSICDINTNSEELRVDVGFDSKLANCDFISLEDVYKYLKNEIAKGNTFQEHVNYLTNKIGARY